MKLKSQVAVVISITPGAQKLQSLGQGLNTLERRIVLEEHGSISFRRNCKNNNEASSRLSLNPY